MPAKLVFTPNAEAQLEAIGDYIAKDNPSAAVRMVQALRDRCLPLKDHPHLGRPYNDRYRVLVEGRYLIFYRMEEGAETTIVITLVVHGARDLSSLTLG